MTVIYIVVSSNGTRCCNNSAPQVLFCHLD